MNPNQQPYTKGQLAVRRARLSSDYVVLAATFVGFFLITSIYFIVTSIGDLLATEKNPDFLTVVITLLGAGVGAALLFGVFLLVGMFMVRMQRQTMLGNALQVEYSDYAWLRDWANGVSADLELPRIEIFVTQDPMINAYAMGFARPYIIVLNSGTIRYLTHDEIKTVVVHEMGHIKYGHTSSLVYLTPFLSLPIVSIIGTWVAGFWQRRSELTADRLALMYCADSELLKQALIKVHVGPDVAKSMNETARQWLQYTAERPMNHLAQTFSSHPFLVRRLSHIDRWKSVIEPQQAMPTADVTPAAS